MKAKKEELTRQLAMGVIGNIDKTTPGGFRPSLSGFRQLLENIAYVWAILIIMFIIGFVAINPRPDRSAPTTVEIIP